MQFLGPWCTHSQMYFKPSGFEHIRTRNLEASFLRFEHIRRCVASSIRKRCWQTLLLRHSRCPAPSLLPLANPPQILTSSSLWETPTANPVIKSTNKSCDTSNNLSDTHWSPKRPSANLLTRSENDFTVNLKPLSVFSPLIYNLVELTVVSHYIPNSHLSIDPISHIWTFTMSSRVSLIVRSVRQMMLFRPC